MRSPLLLAARTFLALAFISVAVAADVSNLPSNRNIKAAKEPAPIKSLAETVEAMVPMLAKLQEDSGDQHAKSGKYREAMGEYETALLLYRRVRDDAKVSTLLLKIGKLQAFQGQDDSALVTYKEALAIARDIADIEAEGQIHWEIGLSYERQAQYEQALYAYMRALTTFQQTGNSDASREVLERVHFTYHRLARYVEGIAYYEKTLQTVRERNDRVLEGVLLHHIAVLESRRKRFADALQRYQEALAIARETADRRGEAEVLNDIGAVYATLGSNDEALVYHEQALAIAKALGDAKTTADTLVSIGGIYLGMGLPDKSIHRFEHALEAYREIDDKMGIASSLVDLGNVYAVQRQKDEAIEHWKQAANVYRKAGLQENENLTYLRIAMHYGMHRQFDQAVAYAERVSANIVDFDNRPANAALLNISAAIMCLSGRCETAIAASFRAIMILETTDDPELRWTGWTMLQTIFTWLGHHSSAIVAGKRAVDILQTVRATNLGMAAELLASFIGSNSSVYRNLASLLIREGRIAEAEQVLAMLKEREYFDFIQRDAEADVVTSRVEYTPAEQAWWERYSVATSQLVATARHYSELERRPDLSTTEKAELEALETVLDDAQERFLEILAALKKEFEDKGPRALALGERQLDFLETLQPTLAELGPGTVLIHTVITRDRLHLILTTPDVRLARHSSISETKLNRLIGRFRQALQQPKSDTRLIAQELYEHLVKPLDADLTQAGARMLMWSLDGALRYIPMAALYDGERYLVERYPVALYTPAVQAKLAPGTVSAWQVAGLGVSRPHAGFTALPAVPQELEGIVKQSEADTDGVVPGVIYLDDSFDRDRLKQVLRERFPVVHIASHFHLGHTDERSSFLLLGDGSALNVEDFRKGRAFSLNGVNLLTLSACSTALGSGDSAGGEVESFGVLAQKRGVGSVLATLWPVADESTGLFMKHLYRIRSEQPTLTKAEALRRAQLTLLRGEPISQFPEREDERGLKRLYTARDTTPYGGPGRFAHPYYWAPFILMGNWL